MSKEKITKQEIIDIAKEMNTQDVRGTRSVVFMVMERYKQYGDRFHCEERERNYDASSWSLCSECKKLQEGDEMPNECDMCDSDAFHWYSWEEKLSETDGVFLTGRECDEYIKRRHYNFPNGAWSYGISVWRSDQMSKLLNYVSNLHPESNKNNNYD